MNFKVFSAMTVLGSAISCSILAYLGVGRNGLTPDLLQ